ncbi:hypothetical protein CHLNCDRAFT_133392 [Chlorella variabilis]|uniref:Amino acid transporter transmembrane domain-containing protein n=1 Tax=Chlorella variabilis TaxID=554065 RepID=E1Z303_CHLVA|nr:hypothetical protein CHLNCDRAFT_133392 [Chlorella variabilis]EFN60084.1 hypothetical protein CHLNCDRAFT_133392 [Chlorella variabilis]|eukprot:XP_005852186.1 hypothetical protein CHLNCDRAFT_133392 [Chlorella variabilis]
MTSPQDAEAPLIEPDQDDRTLRDELEHEEEVARQEDALSRGDSEDLAQIAASVLHGETRLTQAGTQNGNAACAAGPRARRAWRMLWLGPPIATANLATTIIGAGIMALPRAFATLGVVLGASMLAVIFVLSFFSLGVLVRVSQLTHHWTYHDVVSAEYGYPGLLALKLAIIINNAGSMIVYLIIIADVLCGVPPDYNGLVTNLLGVHDPSVWFVSRPFVLAVCCVLVLAPLLSLRDLGRLGPMSTAGVVVAGGFAVSVVGITGIAIAKGQVGDFHWLPTAEMMGDTPSQVAVNLLAVLPVISLSFICHYNVHPIAHSLERFSNRRMMMVIRRALIVCTLVFTLVAGGGYILFGSSTLANILNNLTPDSLAPVVGQAMGSVLSFANRLGYCISLMVRISLMATFAMLNWALRETVTKLLFHKPVLPGPGFHALSYALLAVIYLVAILVPSVWTAMSVTGATAATFIAFILPGFLILRVASRTHRLSATSRVLALVCVVLGFTMGTVTLLNTFWLSKS